jgi:hypothetical protein
MAPKAFMGTVAFWADTSIHDEPFHRRTLLRKFPLPLPGSS